MPIISAVVLFCYDKFEEIPIEKVVNMSKLTKSYFREDICIVLKYFRLLVFAQKRSNKWLAYLMAMSFFLEFILALIIQLLQLDGLLDYQASYWLATAHPLSRLPVFFMGICAGVLCIRIQNGDLDALNRKHLV